MRKPIIGIPADRRLLNSHWFHCVGEKYIDAVVQAADAVPVLVPALGERYLREWLASFDGILFTGSPSNVEPHRYLGPKSAPGTLHDPERDATTLPDDQRRRRCGHADPRHLPRLPGDQRRARRLAHAEAPGRPRQPRPSRGHRPCRWKSSTSRRTRSSWWKAACCTRSRAAAASRSIRCTRRASSASRRGSSPRRPPRTAWSRPSASTARKKFALAVQWHPEWKVMENPFSRALFAAFGQAGRDHASRRSR